MSGKTMFCRCEDVTLAEIEHAFAEGHHDIESLKRYSGFGTGWCQGKQCVVLCARFLVERTGSLPGAPVTPRPPTHPMPLGLLANLGSDPANGAASAPDGEPARTGEPGIVAPGKGGS